MRPDIDAPLFRFAAIEVDDKLIRVTKEPRQIIRFRRGKDEIEQAEKINIAVVVVGARNEGESSERVKKPFLDRSISNSGFPPFLRPSFLRSFPFFDQRQSVKYEYDRRPSRM